MNSGLTFQDAYTKFQTISGSTNATDLTQAKQDINIGYKLLNAAIARYFTRKQAFADLTQGQKYYQTPIDSIRIMEASVLWSAGYEYPLTEVRSEHDWRLMNIYPNYQSLPQFYYVYGNDQIGLYPTPSQTISAGLRYVYQPQDVDLSIDDYVTGTASIANGAVAVTGVGTTWTTSMAGRMFQITDGTDGSFYEVLSVGSTTTLTLKTPYVGPTASGTTYRIAQVFMFPGEYHDAPVDYALARFFESRNNPPRATYHRANFENKKEDAVRRYASSSTSQVITEDEYGLFPRNIWLWPPMPGS